ncbi:MAG: DUF262 domain-containing protein [Chloroflexi bacterium]|nr:DUF262 domain-containing protein [Chloroflexota bacterium]MCY3937342.1 DUF262 domain-containing protein [Chloroflexota bacterium]
MKTDLKFHSIAELVDLRRANMATANPEYQRGQVWREEQQKRLIDSVMRGYQLPIIYLHFNEETAGGLIRQSYHIIDGQQRITALYRFAEGAFRLFAADDKLARFPRFQQDQPCPWGNKYFHELEEDLQGRFLNSELPVAYITTDNENEVRDLFVRLQQGVDLNDQETRDAYPGQFTEFILAIGGKPQIDRYPGHDFFQRVLKMKPGRDRGRTRRLASQIAMLFLERRRRRSDHFIDIRKQAIDNYYYANLDFDSDSDDCKRFRAILTKLNQLLGDGTGPKLKAHDAIHLTLFLDSIWDDYTRSWEASLQQAQAEFSALMVQASLSAREGNPDETWLNYGVWTRSNSDRGENIRRRHRYYCRRMIDFLGNLTPKDPQRAFNPLEREYIYWRDRNCRRRGCGAEVAWDEAEIHHIRPHSQGGRTELENGALLHKHCHEPMLDPAEILPIP